MLKHQKITNEHTQQIETVLSGTVPKFPKGGSQGIYPVELFKKLNQVKSSAAIRLFFAMNIGANEYGIVIRTREQLSLAIQTKYDRGNMSRLLTILEEDELIMKFSNSYLINPFIILPTIKDVRLKSAIQEVWRANEFH